LSRPEVLIALRRARDLTDRDFARPLTLDSMAKAAHLSKFHFARAFTKAYGETPRTYLTRRRIERAKDLLRAANLTITEICFLVGFESVGSFSSRFRDLVGMSPTEYRSASAGAPPIPGASSSCGRGRASPDPGSPRSRRLLGVEKSAIRKKRRRRARGSVRAMIKLSHVNVFVEDQDRAKAFYTEKLGFEVRSDATLDGFRWLTVGPKDQPDLNILLARPQPPMFSEEDAQALLRLVAKGVMGAGVIETDDIRTAYEDLKGKGVTFLQEPAERPYGIEALFRDDSGNWFSLNQHKRYGS